MVRDPPETRLSRIHRDSLLTSACLLAQRLEIELLKKNIQPHFLLNTLTVLIEVIEQAPATAVKLIEAVATTSMPLTTPGGGGLAHARRSSLRRQGGSLCGSDRHSAKVSSGSRAPT
jgi:hypothetical protein